MLPEMIGYIKRFNETKYIFFLIKDDELLKNITIKIKSYNDKIKANFHENGMSRRPPLCLLNSNINTFRS